MFEIHSIKLSEEHSTAAPMYMNECQDGHFNLVESTHLRREVKDD